MPRAAVFISTKKCAYAMAYVGCLLCWDNSSPRYYCQTPRHSTPVRTGQLRMSSYVYQRYYDTSVAQSVFCFKFNEYLSVGPIILTPREQQPIKLLYFPFLGTLGRFLGTTTYLFILNPMIGSYIRRNIGSLGSS